MSSLENAMSILNLLCEERPVLRVSEVYRALGMPKSSVSRLLGTLHDAGLLEREAGEAGYRAGPRTVGLASLYVNRYSIADLVERAIDELVSEFGFTGYLSVLSGSDIVLLRVKQGSHPLQYVRDVGARLPSTQTSMGCVMLARLSKDELAQYLPQKMLADRITGGARLRKKIEIARKDGVVVTPSVLNLGITTISAAVRDPESGKLISLALAFPENAVDAALLRRMRMRVLANVRGIGQKIGDPFWTGAGGAKRGNPRAMTKKTPTAS